MKKTDLPDFFRYVWLMEKDEDGEPDYCTVVRAPNPKTGWNLIFESPRDDGDEVKVFHFPETWRYYDSKLSKFIEERNAEKNPEFTLENLRKRFSEAE